MSGQGMPPPWFVIPIFLGCCAAVFGAIFLLGWWLA